MNSIISSIVDYFLFIINYPWRLAIELLEWIVDFVVNTTVQLAYGLMPEGLADFLSSTIDTREVASMVQTATWWIPVFGILAIYLNAYALAGTIRLARWIIGFIPTVEG